ncbi:hypothetical protein [Demequina activiva]|uniref:Uncharacterized protein n=1 Tax=Demequina activiva TaxID=1582364 RepID=A0A919UKJ4_9MICO|nr:hypothetical protein [Demequina activiva]GIG55331.1 hypothetical protein Dac01nite_20830 [Demequina activiva]
MSAGFTGGVTVSYSQTFYPERGSSAPRQSRGGAAMGPAERIHPPRANALPHAPVEPDRERVWPRALALSAVLSLAGGVLYVALQVLVGQEILAATIVIGVLAGAGMRLGGLADRWLVAFAAAGIAMLAWMLASAVGTALDRALHPEQSLITAFESSIAPDAIIGMHASEPLLALVAALLVSSGAVVATAMFTRSRSRALPWD